MKSPLLLAFQAVKALSTMLSFQDDAITTAWSGFVWKSLTMFHQVVLILSVFVREPQISFPRKGGVVHKSLKALLTEQRFLLVGYVLSRMVR